MTAIRTVNHDQVGGILEYGKPAGLWLSQSQAHPRAGPAARAIISAGRSLSRDAKPWK